mgnify:CR=1 FL=1
MVRVRAQNPELRQVRDPETGTLLAVVDLAAGRVRIRRTKRVWVWVDLAWLLDKEREAG